MKQHLSRLLSSARENAERGAVLFLVAITALIVMVAGAIAVDLSAIATRGQDLQNAADSAALAGVQAYRQSMGDSPNASAADEAAAIAAVNALLEQNGITDITPQIEFPDDEHDTEVKVTLFDGDAGFLLSGFTGGNAGTVERTATARFERCEDGCQKEVSIPPPFTGINTTGDGDGYVPIPVGDRLYSINHQSGDSYAGTDRGSLQITCVNRNESLCWDTPGRSAYPSSPRPRITPEMPHAAVWDTKIYWASSTSSGHYMFCFETETSTPCSNPLLLNSSTHAWGILSDREAHRGGGTIEEDGLIYTFTDDHKVHCIVPGPTMSRCSGYPAETSIGAIGFPDNLPSEGNHGSSIDPIVDDQTNRIYSTIHINRAGGECSNPEPNLREPRNHTVVLKNAASGVYIGINDSNNGLVDITDASNPDAHWEVRKYNGYYRFTSVGADNDGRTRYLTTPDDLGEEAYPQSSHVWDAYWRLDDGYNTSTLRTVVRVDGEYPYLREASSGGQLEFVVNRNYASGLADWIIRPWGCEVPPQTYGGLTYLSGTYLNCFDTGAGAPCAGFTPVRLHVDPSLFSGRLFFSRNGSGTPVGVCSTGFSREWIYDSSSYQDDTEVTCVNLNGGDDNSQEAVLAPFRNALAYQNRGLERTEYDPNCSCVRTARWGTWGDPHWNDEANRTFYPTHRVWSSVLCWDWSSGGGGSACAEGLSRATQSALGPTQDYGYFSEGNCIFGLGHTAVFWAFRANDITQECNASSATTSITPCACGGDLFWGTIGFDVTIEQFDKFTIEILDDDGFRVYPVGENTPPHSLITDGDTIDLNFIPATSATQRLWVHVDVEAKSGVDPWEDGEGSQTFTIEINRTPHLTN